MSEFTEENKFIATSFSIFGLALFSFAIYMAHMSEANLTLCAQILCISLIMLMAGMQRIRRLRVDPLEYKKIIFFLGIFGAVLAFFSA